MILKLFGILDLLSGVVLIILRFIPLGTLAWIFVIYLFFKSLIFIKNISSMVDLIAAIFVIFAIFGHYSSITWIFVLWLLQKGFFSLLD